jgi:hypothetical protein
MAREQIRSFQTVHLDYHPQESHLVTFKDPYSFPTLYHPDCNDLVVRHMEEIAEKVRARDMAGCAHAHVDRSPESALPSASIPSYDTTDRGTQHTRRVSSARIWPGLSKISWTSSLSSTKTSHPRRTVPAALYTSPIEPWT